MSADLKLAFTLALRELRGGLSGFRVFLICLAIGTAAIAAIGTVRSAIETGLSTQGAVILGGDAEIQLTYRFATDTERAWFKSQGAVSELVDFRSMLVTDQGDRALTQVKGVDSAYPLYGTVRLSPSISVADMLKGRDDLPGIAVDPVLMDRLGLALGDTAMLGSAEFAVMAALERMPDSAGSGFSMGPPVLIASAALEGSGLIAPGTLFETEYRIRTDADLLEMQTQAQTALDGTGYRWRDRRNAAPGIAEFVERLSAFLVIVGLTGLAVGGVGVATAVRSYLSEKTEAIATLRTIGASGRVIFLLYGQQIGMLAALGIGLGLVLGSLVPLLLGPLIEARLPIPAEFSLRARPLLEAAIYSTFSAMLFTLWPLARVEKIRAASLFREGRQGGAGLPALLWIVVCAGLFAALITSAAWLTGLWKLTLWAAVGIAATFLTLFLAAIAAKRIARVIAPRIKRARLLRFALGAIGGSGRETPAVVISLGLGLSVLAAVGQIDRNLRDAVATDLPEVAPAFFVIDIQPDQLDPLLSNLAERDAVTKIETAPMLRGIITRINDRPARDVAGDHWVLQGDRGITYSDTPTEGTTLTHGAWWDANYAGEPQISFATEEALEMGLNLGDSLTVNVLGRDITARVTSFREVDFSSGGIGFILSMNPAALQGAPHSHIATLYAKPEAEGTLLRELSQSYPNITMIRVRDAIDRIAELLSGIAAAVTYGALATLLTGVVVLIGTAAAGERARIHEGAILKTLGATRRDVLSNFLMRSALLGATAGLIAILAGVTAGWAVSTFVMETEFRVAYGSAIAIILGGITATLLTSAYFAWRPLQIRPASVLRAQE